MNLNEHPTPGTDAFYNGPCKNAITRRQRDFARQLEREAAALLAICERYRAGTVDLYPREYGDQEYLDEISGAFDALKSQLTPR
jgi:hypothetical protein